MEESLFQAQPARKRQKPKTFGRNRTFQPDPDGSTFKNTNIEATFSERKQKRKRTNSDAKGDRVAEHCRNGKQLRAADMVDLIQDELPTLKSLLGDVTKPMNNKLNTDTSTERPKPELIFSNPKQLTLPGWETHQPNPFVRAAGAEKSQESAGGLSEKLSAVKASTEHIWQPAAVQIKEGPSSTNRAIDKVHPAGTEKVSKHSEIAVITKRPPSSTGLPPLLGPRITLYTVVPSRLVKNGWSTVMLFRDYPRDVLTAASQLFADFVGKKAWAREFIFDRDFGDPTALEIILAWLLRVNVKEVTALDLDYVDTSDKAIYDLIELYSVAKRLRLTTAFNTLDELRKLIVDHLIKPKHRLHIDDLAWLHTLLAYEDRGLVNSAIRTFILSLNNLSSDRRNKDLSALKMYPELGEDVEAMIKAFAVANARSRQLKGPKGRRDVVPGKAQGHEVKRNGPAFCWDL